ncbi:hypothetical protein V3C99_003541 [Haemonchus contortus]
MRTCKQLLNGIILTTLLTICTVLFILQSIYFIIRGTESSEKQYVKTVDGSPLAMPALVICNRMPFSQDGVNSVNAAIRQDQPMRYLLQWTNPSLVEEADFMPMSQRYMEQGQTALFQYMPQNVRNQTIDQMEYKCQSMINSCTYQGMDIQAFDCCRNVLYKLPTTKGLCWMFYDRLLTQNSSSPLHQFAITFQMTRNSWYSEQAMPVHPGVDVYLKKNADDIVDLIGQLENPLRLMDKKGMRVRMHKEERADLRRSSCGQTLGDAVSVDNDNYANNRTNLLMCVIMVSIQYCNCHPLLAEMIPYDRMNYRHFSYRVNTTQVCTIDQYESCARRYIDLTRPSAWTEDIPAYISGSAELKQCRSENPYPCVTTSYPGMVDQYDLPPVYRSTQDFVARLVLEYTTTRVTEVLLTKDPNLYELLSYIGYNLATWFAIGHMIWSVYRLIRDTVCCTNKVAPESPKRVISISEPLEAQVVVETKESPSDVDAS